MTKSKDEQIFIGVGSEVIELTGVEKEAFLAERATMQAQTDALKKETETQKALKISAYTKLGLTEEEINAIL